MTETTIWMLWGAAAATPLAVNVLTKRGPDPQGIALMILLLWCVGFVMRSFWSPPESMRLYPVIDAIAGTVCFLAWRTRPGAWKLVLTGLYTAQCANHLAFWLAWPLPGSLYLYVLINNLLFIAQLVTAASPGGLHIGTRIADRLGLRLPGLAGTARHGGHSRWR